MNRRLHLTTTLIHNFFSSFLVYWLSIHKQNSQYVYQRFDRTVNSVYTLQFRQLKSPFILSKVPKYLLKIHLPILLTSWFSTVQHTKKVIEKGSSLQTTWLVPWSLRPLVATDFWRNLTCRHFPSYRSESYERFRRILICLLCYFPVILHILSLFYWTNALKLTLRKHAYSNKLKILPLKMKLFR